LPRLLKKKGRIITLKLEEINRWKNLRGTQIKSKNDMSDITASPQELEAKWYTLNSAVGQQPYP
jgi:hypothetical protein